MWSDYYLHLLTPLAQKIHERNVRLGFYEPEKVRDFDGMMMNVVGEVSEAHEEWRHGRGFNETYWMVDASVGDSFRAQDGKLYVRNYDYDSLTDQPEWLEMTPKLLRNMPNMVGYLKPEGIPSELADIIIRVLDIAAFHEIDIAGAIADKMLYNETRPYRHGNKRS